MYLPKTFILYHKNPLTGTNDANCVINSKKFLKKLDFDPIRDYNKPQKDPKRVT